MITLRNKIGQMLVMGFDGCDIHDKSPVAEWLSTDGLGEFCCSIRMLPRVYTARI